MPKRIQRKRTKGWRMPKGAVYVGRPTRWGNPFDVVEGVGIWYVRFQNQRQAGVAFLTKLGAESFAAVSYRNWIESYPGLVEKAKSELRGKDLACWCPLHDENGQPVPCHADVLLELANALPDAAQDGLDSVAER